MATETTKLVRDQTVELRIERVLSRGKSFIIFLEGEKIPVILAKVIAADKFFVDDTQFTQLQNPVKVTPTRMAEGGTSGLPAWLANIELPLAPVSNHPLVMRRQEKANDYALAALYAQQAVEA